MQCQDMIRGGYCFVTGQGAGDFQPRDCLYLVSEQSVRSHEEENSVSSRKQLESMGLTMPDITLSACVLPAGEV